MPPYGACDLGSINLTPFVAAPFTDRARLDPDLLLHRILARRFLDAEHTPPDSTAADAIMAAARQVSRTVRAAAVVCYSTSGSTARW